MFSRCRSEGAVLITSLRITTEVMARSSARHRSRPRPLRVAVRLARSRAAHLGRRVRSGTIRMQAPEIRLFSSCGPFGGRPGPAALRARGPPITDDAAPGDSARAGAGKGDRHSAAETEFSPGRADPGGGSIARGARGGARSTGPRSQAGPGMRQWVGRPASSRLPRTDGDRFASPRAARLRQLHADVDLRLYELHTNDAIDALHATTIDSGLLRAPANNDPLPSFEHL